MDKEYLVRKKGRAERQARNKQQTQKIRLLNGFVVDIVIWPEDHLEKDKTDDVKIKGRDDGKTFYNTASFIQTNNGSRS